MSNKIRGENKGRLAQSSHQANLETREYLELAKIRQSQIGRVNLELASSRMINVPAEEHLRSKNMTFITNQQPVSSFQMMENLLKGVVNEKKGNTVSEGDKQKWGQLLTNRYKMEAYKLIVLNQIAKDTQTAPHLKFLLFLLTEIQKSNLEVNYGDKLQLQFNGGTIRRQSEEIGTLQGQKQGLEKDLMEVSRQYQKILFNFNSVIENLVHKESPPLSPK